MRIKETTVYQYDELNDRAKQKAIEWFSKDYPDYDWWDYLLEDAKRIGLTITEFDLGGSKKIRGSLNTSIEECCELISHEHGKTCDTYKLAEEWYMKAKDLRDQIENTEDDQELEDLQDTYFNEFESALLEEYFSMLDKEYDYLTSKEQIEETIRANAYEFTEEGEIA